MATRIYVALLTAAFLLSSCDPIPAAATVGAFVPVGQVELRDLTTTTETVSNCGGRSTIIKHPSMTVLTNHSVEWEVGGTFGFGIVIGKGVVPGGVDLSPAVEARMRGGSEVGTQQGTAWDLPAEPNTAVEYTIMWREVWQPGYTEVRSSNQQVTQVYVRYRSGVQSDIVGQRQLYCNPGQTLVDPLPPAPPAYTPAPVIAPVSTTGPRQVIPTPTTKPEECKEKCQCHHNAAGEIECKDCYEVCK